jgi:CDP-6-deoxy-D-xylo-4-hexulose-3-dehydrase
MALPDADDAVELLMVTGRPGQADQLLIGHDDYQGDPLPEPAFVRLARPLRLGAARLVPLTVSVRPEFVIRVRKALLLRDTRAYTEAVHDGFRPGTDPRRRPFDPHRDAVPYAGRCFDADEVEAAVSATLDFWLTLGPEGDAFAAELAGWLGVRKSILVNSGSSANLLAIAALTSPKLGERRLRPGDEVITCAAGFPTTVAPILQHGLVPVFIDNDPGTLNARADQLEQAYVPGKTKAVILAHSLGNPFDLSRVVAFCQQHGLWLIEDNCDALGSRYAGAAPVARESDPSRAGQGGEGGIEGFTGGFGDLSTQSFYPPHHLTMGEGGAVNVVRDMKLKVLVESFRDWGRDCWCDSGKDNTCHKRFGWKLGELPEGYDHKYIYSHLGYNLKPLDIQAAIGRAQLKKLPAFVQARQRHWEYLRRGLADLEEFFEFQLPTHARAWTPDGFLWKSGSPRSPMASPPTPTSPAGAPASAPVGPWCQPSWFGFTLLVRPGAPFARRDLVRALDAARIGSRAFFGGNLVRQPAWVELRQANPSAFRVVGDLAGADRIMNEAVFLGVYPGLTGTMLDRMVDTVRSFVGRH